MQKKIQFLFDHFYPSVGGVQYNTLQTYSRLIKQGWQVEALVMNFELSPGVTCKSQEIIQGITVKRYNYFLYNFLPFLIDLDLKNTLICLHDFIILPHYYIYLITLIKKVAGKKTHTLILHSHGLFGSPLKPYKGFDLFKRRIKKFIDRSMGVYLVNRSVDAIRAVSINEKNALIKAGISPALIEVINNGVNFNEIPESDDSYSDEIKSLAEKYRPYIFQMGRIDRFKNYEQVIKSLALVSKDINLLIIGPEQDNKNYKLELDELIKKLQLVDRVCFTGGIMGIDKYFIMKNSLACIHMAINEGYGNVINEAMSQGCICLVSNTISEELIDNNFNGIRIPINDTASLAFKINDIYQNSRSSFYLDIKRNAKISVKNRGWDDVAKKIDAFYFKTITNEK